MGQQLSMHCCLAQVCVCVCELTRAQVGVFDKAQVFVKAQGGLEAQVGLKAQVWIYC
jgi:hypothetical protein